MIDDEPKRIVAVAILKGGLIFTKPLPARHHSVLHEMSQLGIQQDYTVEQGFLTDTGDWVSRRAALIIAEKAGQLEGRTKTNPLYELFSEDLW